MRNACTCFGGKAEGEGPSEDAAVSMWVRLKMDVKKIGWNGVNWIHLV
jgi:hypothetical protein